MSRVKKILTELDDYELAYFAKYKLLTFMKGTQSEIREYLIERNLTPARIDQRISENPDTKLNDEKVRCPRCYSDKLRKDQVEWYNTAGRYGYSDEVAALDGLAGRATYKEKIICNVCGYWLTDPNNERGKSFWRTVWNYLTENRFGI